MRYTMQYYRSLYPILRGQLMARHLTHDDVAQSLGITQATVSRKLAAGYPWTLDEMYKLMDLIEWPYDKMHILFPRGGHGNAGAEMIAKVESITRKSKAGSSGEPSRTSPTNGKSYSVAHLAIAGGEEQVEIRCPKCDAELGLIVTTQLVMVPNG